MQFGRLTSRESSTPELTAPLKIDHVSATTAGTPWNLKLILGKIINVLRFFGLVVLIRLISTERNEVL